MNLPVAGSLLSDLRYGVRLLFKTPGFSLLAIVMIAIGTGANAAVFSVVRGVLLESPFDRPEEIASIAIVSPRGQGSQAVPRDVLANIAAVSVPGTFAEFTIGSPVVTGVDAPRRVQVECVAGSMANLLGARPMTGRWFSREEDTPTGPAVAVVSHGFWRSVLNSDPAVLGRRLLLDDQPVEVIGVMPKGFDGPLSRPNRDIWAPMGQVTPARRAYGCRLADASGNAVIRVPRGLASADAQARLNAALGPIPMAGGNGSIRLIPVLEQTHRGLQPMLLALTGAVLAVLLIACANVANLGLARLVGRRSEIGVRLALGATRGRIIRQTLVEQLVIASAGAAAGLMLAFLTFEALVALLPQGIPQKDLVSLNVPVLLASVAVTIASSVLIGLVPAIQCSRVSLRSGLANTERTATRGSRVFRWSLVMGELALGVLLLVGALLMIRTFLTLRPDTPGFDPLNKNVALTRLPTTMTVDGRRRFAEETARHLVASGAARDVAVTTYLPMSRSLELFEMTLEGQKGQVITSSISPNYLELMSIPVTRGRAFQTSDGPGAESVVLVNEAFVRRWLPAREPLNAVVDVRTERGPSQPRRIVGVVGDTRFSGADTQARPEVYLPLAQEMRGNPYFIMSGNASELAMMSGRLREIVGRIQPGQLVDRIDRLDTLLAREVAYPRLGAWLLGLFGGIALLLATIGLGSTLAWSVAERRREIGIRMALGASPRRVRRMILGQTTGVAVLAIVIGLTGAAFATRLIEGWLYGIARHDVVTYATCAGLMLGAALLAAYVPTRRATSVDPLVALRTD